MRLRTGKTKGLLAEAAAGLVVPPLFGGSAALAILLGKLYLAVVLAALGFGIFLRFKRGRVDESGNRD